MKRKLLAALASGTLVLTAAACSQPTSAPATAAPAQAAGAIRSTGVVTQVDAAAGTVTFDHQAIPAINWPPMTMQFHAEDPMILHGLTVGDHVSFELKSASETGVVTVIQKQ